MPTIAPILPEKVLNSLIATGVLTAPIILPMFLNPAKKSSIDVANALKTLVFFILVPRVLNTAFIESGIFARLARVFASHNVRIYLSSSFAHKVSAINAPANKSLTPSVISSSTPSTLPEAESTSVASFFVSITKRSF